MRNGRSDRRSSNGDGWNVTGDLPAITCAPSIVVPGYHGYLRDGVFTADIDGRAPCGTVRELPPLRGEQGSIHGAPDWQRTPHTTGETP